MKTIAFKKTDFDEKWYIVDAKDQVLGRMAARIAAILRGKHTPHFTPNQDMGGHVVVINADKIVLTGKKAVQKQYFRHSGYIGGIKSISAKNLLQDYPDRLVKKAITGMLPKTKLGKAMAKKLRVYAGEKHPHAAQNPEGLRLS